MARHGGRRAFLPTPRSAQVRLVEGRVRVRPRRDGFVNPGEPHWQFTTVLGVCRTQGQPTNLRSDGGDAKPDVRTARLRYPPLAGAHRKRPNVNEIFRQHVEQLHGRFEALMRMDPLTLTALPKDIPKSGIYLFSEGPRHLYVGRSKRLRHRIRYHSSGSAEDAPFAFEDAPFAFKLAREQTGNAKASYSPTGSRRALLADPVFREAFQASKRRIRQMDVRFVAEPDTNRQALLEIYAAIALGAPYNDFDTH